MKRREQECNYEMVVISLFKWCLTARQHKSVNRQQCSHAMHVFKTLNGHTVNLSNV